MTARVSGGQMGMDTGGNAGSPGLPPARTWRCADHLFELDHTLVMGVLNVTPDSFSDGGEHASFDEAVLAAKEMVADGADIIDVGGESTRPGSDAVSVSEELSRTVDVVGALAELGIPVSIDTRHAPVAAACLKAGACIINDVSGFRDPAMREVLASSDAGCVVMHMAGEPKTMQVAPHYDDVVSEVGDYLLEQAHLLESLGVDRERICIDPGPGFGKTTEHNVALIEASDKLSSLGYPLMVAVSRKRFIGELYGVEVARERTWPSVAFALHAVEKGARIARVHDVAMTRAALDFTALPESRSLIALGSNMGDSIAELQEAYRLLDGLPYTRTVAGSGLYVSEPAYLEDQPPFVNAVAEIATRLHPYALLAELHRLENAAGRIRTVANGPRPLDLDILDYEGWVCDEPDLTLPHPRILERDFVVTPLLDLADAGSAVLGHVVLADGSVVDSEHVTCGKVVARVGNLAS